MATRRTDEKDLEELREQINDLAEQVNMLASESVEEIEGDLEDIAGDRWSNVRHKAKRAGEKTREFVDQHPWESVATGAVLGFLAGFFLQRHSRH